MNKKTFSLKKMARSLLKNGVQGDDRSFTGGQDTRGH